jgi:hypothetical protein
MSDDYWFYNDNSKGLMPSGAGTSTSEIKFALGKFEDTSMLRLKLQPVILDEELSREIVCQDAVIIQDVKCV